MGSPVSRSGRNRRPPLVDSSIYGPRLGRSASIPGILHGGLLHTLFQDWTHERPLTGDVRATSRKVSVRSRKSRGLSNRMGEIAQKQRGVSEKSPRTFVWGSYYFCTIVPEGTVAYSPGTLVRFAVVAGPLPLLVGRSTL